MAVFDIIIIVVIVLSIAIGLWRGFIREVLSLLSWILAFWVAFSYTPVAGLYLEPHIETPVLRTLAAFSGLFLGTLLVASLASYLLHKMFAATGITRTDRTLGAAFGLLRGVVIVARLLTFGRLTALPEQAWWKQSILVDQFEPVVALLVDVLPRDVGQRLGKG